MSCRLWINRLQYNLLETHFIEHGRPDTLNHIEIWVCESADCRPSRITPLCAWTVVHMRMGSEDFGGRQASTFSPETCRQPIRSLSVSFHQRPHMPCHCHPISALSHCRCDCHNTRLREKEFAHCGPELILIQSALWEGAPSFPQRDAFSGERERDEKVHCSDESCSLETLVSLAWIWQPEAKRLSKAKITNRFSLSLATNIFLKCFGTRRLHKHL